MRKLFYSTLALVLFTAFTVSGTDLQKTYTWKYNINKDGNVVIDNYDCNLIVHTWDKGETEFNLTIDAKTKSDEDAKVLDSFLQNLKFSNSLSSVKFGNSFWESRNTIGRVSTSLFGGKTIMGKMTMKLPDGKTVNLTDFSIKAELWIPVGCRFELGSKYSEINLADFSGLLFLNLYNDNFTGANLKGKAEIEDKYSTMEFKEMKDVKADLYNSKLEAGNTGNLKMDSKYSKITTTESGNLEINSYNDKYIIPVTGDITFTAKYSDLKTESAGHVNLDCYEGTINLKQVKDVKITSKYADFQFAGAGNMLIFSSYNDKIAVGKLNSLKINESKYCTYKVDELTGSVSESDGYEDKFSISKTDQEFKGLTVNGQYIEVTLGLPVTVDYRFKAKINYPRLEMNESLLKPRIKIVDGSRLEYDALKGTEKEGMPLIEINGYEMGLKIIDL